MGPFANWKKNKVFIIRARKKSWETLTLAFLILLDVEEILLVFFA